MNNLNRMPTVGEVFKPKDGSSYRVQVFHTCAHCDMVFYRPFGESISGQSETYDKDVFSFNARYILDLDHPQNKV